MHIYTLNKWQHSHDFAVDDRANERKTLRVVILTAAMMGIEIAAGTIFSSMALLADGWHMGTHAAALGIALFAYRYASRNAKNPRYTFGTGKVSVLGGFTSAVILQMVAILIMVDAVEHLFNPQPIQFNQAIAVAALGLVVNLVSVWLLGERGHDHNGRHASQGSHAGEVLEHEKPHGHGHDRDHNLRAAYLHVLADALTSVLAIIALLAGRNFGWVWMDPLVGVVGGLVISRWAIGLLRETGSILLDGSGDPELVEHIRAALESDADTRISDLHVWMIGSQAASAIVSVVTHYPRPVEHYRGLLGSIPELKHVTIEVNECTEEPCLPVETTLLDAAG